MKKSIVLIALVLFLCGCSEVPQTYSFPNQSVAVAHIELLHNRNLDGEGTDESNFYLIRELGTDEIEGFMNAIYALPTRPCGTPPQAGYGEYIAKVTYENGDVEIYSPFCIELIENGGRAWGIGSYCFSDDNFEMLFSQYVDISQLPEPPRK